MKHKPLRVGFDLDGVILYNPARVARPIISFVKKYILRKNLAVFYVPKSSIEYTVWYLFHKSSFVPAAGYKEILNLIRAKKIEAFVVTGRYEMLASDSEKWIRKLQIKKYFKNIYVNKSNEQPYEFKKRMIQKLKLDVFVEDNWDIVRMLASDSSLPHAKIYWICNALDRFIRYPYKFSRLSAALLHLKEKGLKER